MLSALLDSFGMLLLDESSFRSTTFLGHKTFSNQLPKDGLQIGTRHVSCLSNLSNRLASSQAVKHQVTLGSLLARGLSRIVHLNGLEVKAALGHLEDSLTSRTEAVLGHVDVTEVEVLLVASHNDIAVNRVRKQSRSFVSTALRKVQDDTNNNLMLLRSLDKTSHDILLKLSFVELLARSDSRQRVDDHKVKLVAHDLLADIIDVCDVSKSNLLHTQTIRRKSELLNSLRQKLLFGA